LVYDSLQKRVKDLSWSILIVFLLIFMTLVHFFSQSGIVSVIYRYLTFNVQTGYYRTLIWEYASAEALRHPWFGIGYEEYTRPAWMGGASIDAHYLFMATSYGFVPALLYFCISIIIIFILGRCASKSITHISRSTFLGLAASLTVIVILLFTVTFWGSMLAWLNFTLGFAVALTTLSSNLSDGIREPIANRFNKSTS
jgi:O-antigen ligase